MAHPPSSSASRLPSSPSHLLSGLAEFSRELPSLAGPAEVLDLLLRQARAAWAPAECAACWNGPPRIVRAWPAPSSAADAGLALAVRRGPLLLAGDPTGESAGAAPLPPNDIAGAWLLVPIPARGGPAGAIAIRGGPDAFGDADLVAAQGLAAVAAQALSPPPAAAVAAEPSWQADLDVIPSALFVVDESGSIRRANQAFASLVGAERQDLIGQPWRSHVPAEWVGALDRITAADAPDRQANLELGDDAYAAIAARVAGPGGRELVVLLTDLTPRRRLQAQLLQAEKMSAIGQLIAGVAHDLNNPLASVVGFAEFLSERPEVPASLREPVSIIREEAERASGIVKNLLGFVRKQERQRRPTPLQPLLDATLTLLGNELVASRVEARLEIEPDLPLAVVEPNQIQQVFVNLIHNAIQAIAATGRPGMVRVRAGRWRDGVALAVIDDGPGMSQAVAAQVFKPFFTTKPEGQGTGLGLSISQGIVNEHGGRITLETVEGEGAKFTVYLPGGEDAGPLAAAGGPGPAAAGLNILVVDDEPHILHYMRATLESWGHTVAEAADGEEACERMVRNRFDLVVADLRMPRLGGRALYERLVREHPSLAQRVVFATGDTVRDDTLAFLKAVGRPYLHKPFSLSELRALLAGVSKAPGA